MIQEVKSQDEGSERRGGLEQWTMGNGAWALGQDVLGCWEGTFEQPAQGVIHVLR